MSYLAGMGPKLTWRKACRALSQMSYSVLLFVKIVVQFSMRIYELKYVILSLSGFF